MDGATVGVFRDFLGCMQFFVFPFISFRFLVVMIAHVQRKPFILFHRIKPQSILPTGGHPVRRVSSPPPSAK